MRVVRIENHCFAKGRERGREAYCLLLDGHEGDCVFTPGDEFEARL